MLESASKLSLAMQGVAKVIPYALAVIMLFAAVTKIITLDRFSNFTTTFTFFPERFRNYIAFIVPLTELVIATLLLLPLTRRLGLWLCMVTLFVFTAFLLYMVANPYSPNCECFGTLELAKTVKLANRLALVRNVILIIVVLLGLLYSTERPVVLELLP